MDKEKIGIFVHELRKEKQMTQKEMADKLGITDKAVSKWERGLSYPDISMLEPIAKLFDVSVMELLQGQRIENETVISVEKAQEVIDQSLIISDSEIHRKHVRSKTAILICSMLLMFMISLLLNVYNLMHRQSMMQNYPRQICRHMTSQGMKMETGCFRIRIRHCHKCRKTAMRLFLPNGPMC